MELSDWAYRELHPKSWVDNALTVFMAGILSFCLVLIFVMIFFPSTSREISLVVLFTATAVALLFFFKKRLEYKLSKADWLMDQHEPYRQAKRAISRCADSARYAGDTELLKRAKLARARLQDVTREYVTLDDLFHGTQSTIRKSGYDAKISTILKELTRVARYFEDQHTILEQILASKGVKGVLLSELPATSKLAELMEDSDSLLREIRQKGHSHS